jgi:hypothetical protein
MGYESLIPPTWELVIAEMDKYGIMWQLDELDM